MTSPMVYGSSSPSEPPEPEELEFHPAGLVERLREVNGERAPFANEWVMGLCHEAADEIERLRFAIYDLVNMERTQTPDMSGKRRTFAYMRNGTVLADCIDRARALLPYDMAETDPTHGGKVSS